VAQRSGREPPGRADERRDRRDSISVVVVLLLDVSLDLGVEGDRAVFREPAVGFLEGDTGQGELLLVILARGAVRNRADLLYGGEEQSDEDGDDGDHHQQLDQREAAPRPETGR